METIERKEKSIRLIIGIVTLVGIAFGAYTAYLSDKSSIEYNKQNIEQNTQSINSLRKELKVQSEKQSVLWRQILIKLTRLETVLEKSYKR